MSCAYLQGFTAQHIPAFAQAAFYVANHNYRSTARLTTYRYDSLTCIEHTSSLSIPADIVKTFL